MIQIKIFKFEADMNKFLASLRVSSVMDVQICNDSMMVTYRTTVVKKR